MGALVGKNVTLELLFEDAMLYTVGFAPRVDDGAYDPACAPRGMPKYGSL